MSERSTLMEVAWVGGPGIAHFFFFAWRSAFFLALYSSSESFLLFEAPRGLFGFREGGPKVERVGPLSVTALLISIFICPSALVANHRQCGKFDCSGVSYARQFLLGFRCGTQEKAQRLL